MTVKDFLKTTVLCIACCSVFGISSSIAMDNNAQINKNNPIEVYKQQITRYFLRSIFI